MLYLKRLLLLLSLIPLGAACCDETCNVENDAGITEPTWSTAFETSEMGTVSNVWGTGPNDVFAVGGNDTRGAVMHFDGTRWSLTEIPDTGLLIWAFGFASDDVYAVGIGGTFVHFDGSTWSILDPGTDEDLWGVFGFTPNDIWVVGGSVNSDGIVLMHYDGQNVTHFSLDDTQNPDGARALFKVWGIDGALFTVGQKGLILRYNGTTWEHQAVGDESNEDFISLWGNAADHIVAVGGRSSARIATFDGTGWTSSAPSGVGGLNAVFMEDDGTTMVGGTWGTAAFYDFATGEFDCEDDLGTQVDVHALWGDGDGKTYAVGGTFLAPHRGVAIVRK
ncbi:MAG: hypothetical protein GY822_26240 [Deltaproteobacteria bacterium]|nr:hypothetical protein [Deltaproteobacteria bacterium]